MVTFGENYVLTEQMNMKTAEEKNRKTEMHRLKQILLAIDKFDLIMK